MHNCVVLFLDERIFVRFSTDTNVKRYYCSVKGSKHTLHTFHIVTYAIAGACQPLMRRWNSNYFYPSPRRIGTLSLISMSTLARQVLFKPYFSF